MDLVHTDDNSLVQLFSGDFPRVIIPVTIANGAGVLVKGTVLGKVTATGEYTDYDNTDNDGTETAKAILAEAVDATLAAVKATAYVSGEFNEDALTGIDDAGKADLEGTPIFVKSIV